MNEKYKKTRKYLNYVKHLFILVLTVTGWVSISAFASLVCVPVGGISSVVVINSCEIIAEIKKYNLIIEKKKKKHDKIVLLEKDKLNTTEVVISEDLIDSHYSHDKSVSLNNVLRESNEMQNEI